jgi:hypothetical protein
LILSGFFLRRTLPFLALRNWAFPLILGRRLPPTAAASANDVQRSQGMVLGFASLVEWGKALTWVLLAAVFIIGAHFFVIAVFTSLTKVRA